MNGILSNQQVEKIRDHPLDLYVSLTKPWTTFYLVSHYQADEIPNMKNIDITSIKRESDGKYVLKLVNKETKYNRQFQNLCKNIISETSQSSEQTGPNDVVSVCKKWSSFLKDAKNMSEETIKGLLGELVFLKNYMIPRFGEYDAVKSWMQPDFGKQDFIINDTWFEVKAISPDSNHITISSLEQLDSKQYGIISTITLRKTSLESNTSITLKQYFQDVCGEIEDNLAKELILEKISIYDANCETVKTLAYEFEGIDLYEVTDEFPRLIRSNVDDAIQKASYDISLSVIKSKYKVNQ